MQSDNFTRADANNLGSNWTVSTGAWQISSNAAFAQAGSVYDLVYWNAFTFNANQYSQIKIGTFSGGSYIGPAVRLQSGSGSGYGVFCQANGSTNPISLQRVDSGSGTVIGGPVNGAAAGDVIKLIAIGNSLTVYQNGTLIIGPITDTNYPTGQPGMSAFGLGPSAVLWVADNNYMFGSPQKVYQASGSTMTVNIPGGGVTLSADTLVFVTTSTRTSGTTGCVTPSGWTLLDTVKPDSIDDQQIFYKLYSSGASLPSTLALSANDAGGFSQSGALSIAYQGINSASPFDGTDTKNSNTSSNTITAATYTTLINGSIALWFFCYRLDEGAGTPTTTQGNLEYQLNRTDSSSHLYISAIDETLPVAGATGTNVFTALPGGTLVASVFTLAVATAASDSFIEILQFQLS